MSDWYELGRKEVIDNIVDIMLFAEKSPEKTAELIYRYLLEQGLVDYDTEKDVFYEWYTGEDK